ncbi:MAG: response regulator [Pirellulaceae bacterium]
MIADILLEFGHDVSRAGEYDEARQALSDTNWNAVITDATLPGGRSGLDLAQVAADNGIPTLVITGDVSVQAHLEHENVDHLRKPFSLDSLMAWVNAVSDPLSSSIC